MHSLEASELSPKGDTWLSCPCRWAGRHPVSDDWLRSLHLAVHVPAEGDVQLPSPVTNGPKQHTCGLSRLLRAEEVEPCDNSRGEEARHFLSDCRLLHQGTQAPGPVCPVSMHTVLCCVPWCSVDRGARCFVIQSCICLCPWQLTQTDNIHLSPFMSNLN